MVYGGYGNDTIFGGSNGIDTLYGDQGDDVITASNSGSLIYGGLGADLITGGTGRDTLYGDVGLDTIYGGGGNDILYGGDNSDTLYGGAGNDTIYGGNSLDVLYGGAGNDIFAFGSVLHMGLGVTSRDVIMDFATGTNRIDFSGFNREFVFRGTGDFQGVEIGVDPLEIRYRHEDGYTIIELNNDPEFEEIDAEIALFGTFNLDVDDFIW